MYISLIQSRENTSVTNRNIMQEGEYLWPYMCAWVGVEGRPVKKKEVHGENKRVVLRVPAEHMLSRKKHYSCSFILLPLPIARGVYMTNASERTASVPIKKQPQTSLYSVRQDVDGKLLKCLFCLSSRHSKSGSFLVHTEKKYIIWLVNTHWLTMTRL